MARSGSSCIATAARMFTGRNTSASMPCRDRRSGFVESIEQNSTGRPVVAQMIGNDIPSLVRTAKELQQLPVAAIDLNLGCPAPIVYKKCAGGGLLREPQRIDSILGALRDAVSIKFTVKTRVGFASPDEFDALLPIFAKHSIDLLTVHARTVAQMYRLPVHYDLIRRAAETMKCPVCANGHVYSADQALDVLAQTKARGLMIGRGVIRSPWLFNQIRQRLRGETPTYPTGREVLDYVTALWESQASFDAPERSQVERMKKFMNYIGEGIAAASSCIKSVAPRRRPSSSASAASFSIMTSRRSLNRRASGSR